MADLDLLRELQVYLVAQGIGSKPANPPPASGVDIVTIWLYPRDGAALPRNIAKSGALVGETTVALVDADLRCPSPMEPWMTQALVRVIVRSPNPIRGKLVQRAIKDLLVPYSAVGGRKGWAMGAIDPVESSVEFQGDQPLPQRQAIGESDPHQTYDRVASYIFNVRRKVLAGLSMP